MFFDSSVCESQDDYSTQIDGSLFHSLSQFSIGQGFPTEKWAEVDRPSFHSPSKSSCSHASPGQDHSDDINLHKGDQSSVSKRVPDDTEPTSDSQVYGGSINNVLQPRMTAEDYGQIHFSDEFDSGEEDSNWYVKRFLEYLPTGHDGIPYSDDIIEENTRMKISKSSHGRYNDAFPLPGTRRLEDYCPPRFKR